MYIHNINVYMSVLIFIRIQSNINTYIFSSFIIFIIIHLLFTFLLLYYGTNSYVIKYDI